MQTARPHPRPTGWKTARGAQQAVSARPLGSSDIAKVELICSKVLRTEMHLRRRCAMPVAQAVTTVIGRQESVLSSDSYQRT